ncbi:protein of unknown function [Candidatus Nitrotoga arctica]|uniref:Uncharacterized protein n=1 Tax=Candidatus Nitrotoga arctica TaxID=453162 RepID=A0ABN8AJ53_9PROT|nr:protein of unknown function [Candidatus Nitrotoga arctica]
MALLFEYLNHPIPQRALNHQTPIQSLQKWYTENQIYLLNVFINRRDLTLSKCDRISESK